MDQDQRRVALAIRTLCRLRSDKRGATVIEYGLIVSLIVVAIMGALSRWRRRQRHVGQARS